MFSNMDTLCGFATVTQFGNASYYITMTVNHAVFFLLAFSEYRKDPAYWLLTLAVKDWGSFRPVSEPS